MPFDDSQAVLAVRNLVFDLTNQHGGGHGGSALGMAAIGVALWKYEMRYNPSNPDWFPRDRFVLSNGHASMFLYIMNHLTGFDIWTMDELKGYGSAKENGYTTICHGHPERQIPGIEITTGPLGQGIANAVGLAIAAKNLVGRFNKPSLPLFDTRIYCMTGDGCLMEGVALEAISLAGHLQLDNLVVLYDNNAVTCDGPLEWINNEDTNAKMRASGWHTIDVTDGNSDVQAIVKALREAKSTSGKPTFINIRTTIGVGTSNAGTAGAHHGVFDTASVEASKRLAGLNPKSTHIIPNSALEFFRERKVHGQKVEQKWIGMWSQYEKDFPTEAQQLQMLMKGELGNAVDEKLASVDISSMQGIPTRESNGLFLQAIWDSCPALFGGGADLNTSNKVRYELSDVFGPNDSWAGRFIRYGIREHAMAAISNGAAAFSPGAFIPFTATFFMFYLYAAPAVRMGALSNLQVIHCATHDSFAEGQNGPTHQPVELDSLYRAMPSLTYIRPADAAEVVGAWRYAIHARNNPSIISLARDSTVPIPNTDQDGVLKGCYVLRDVEDAVLTLVSCGSELHYAVAAADKLTADGFPIRLISAPSLDLFALQPEEYRMSIFPLDGKPIVSVEEYVPSFWARYATASIGMNTYGYSASKESNYRRFELDAEGIVLKCRKYLTELGARNARSIGWRQL